MSAASMFAQLVRQAPDLQPPTPHVRAPREPSSRKRWNKAEHWRKTPWGLTAGQIGALDAVVQYGSITAAAVRLGMSRKTLETHCTRARRAMGVKSILAAALKWDRYLRAEVRP